MELNQRCVEILQFLRDSKDFIKPTDLAQLYHVTDRAIRYNIDKIERFLLSNGFSYLEREHNKGIRIINHNNGLDQFIDSFVNNHNPYTYVYSPQERIFYIAVKLLLADEHLNCEYFQRRLCTSKNTILKELGSVANWFAARNLKLQKRNKVGIWMEGKEIDRRRAVVELASQSLTINDLFDYLKTNKVQSKIIKNFCDEIFSNINAAFLDELLRDAEADLARKFSDKAYCHLLIYLAVTVKRLNTPADLIALKIDNMKRCIEFETAQKMVERLNRKLGNAVAVWETNYIMLYLLGAEVIKTAKKQNISVLLWNKLYIVAQKMADEMEQLCEVNFGKKKRQLVDDLVTFLRPAVYRIKFGVMQEYSACDEVKSKYSELFVKTKLTSRHFERYVNDKIADSDLAYLTMLFVAAIERTRQAVRHYSQTRVIVVCGTGIGTAAMLALKLMDEFNVAVIDTVSCRDLGLIEASRYDLIISTVDLPEYGKDSYIKVNPLLENADLAKLQSRLNLRFANRKHFELSLVNRLIGITEKYAAITDRQQLQYEMMYEIKNSIRNNLERRSIYMLNDLLTWDTIKLNLACSDWKEAVAAGALLLEKKHFVTGAYQAAIIDNFNKFGPYMVVAPGIVLAHARPENGVKEVSMSLITLKSPVEFGHELNDPVKMVITLAALDNESHLEALSQLMELFMNHEDITTILNSTSKEETIDIIQKYAK